MTSTIVVVLESSTPSITVDASGSTPSLDMAVQSGPSVEMSLTAPGPPGDSGITVSDTAPANPYLNQLWLDTSTL